MATALRSTDLHSVVLELHTEAARAHGVPAAVAEGASTATLRKFARLDCVAPDRVRAYYWGVVRRTALRSADDRQGLRTRYLAAALAEDLLRAGHPCERVREEVARQFGRTLPEGTLERIGARQAGRFATGTSPI